MADRRRGLEVARQLEHDLAPAPGRLASVSPSDLAALLAYTKALAVNGRCSFDVALKDENGQYMGSARCALPVEWIGNGWRHEGSCEPWISPSAARVRLTLSVESHRAVDLDAMRSSRGALYGSLEDLGFFLTAVGLERSEVPGA